MYFYLFIVISYLNAFHRNILSVLDAGLHTNGLKVYCVVDASNAQKLVLVPFKFSSIEMLMCNVIPEPQIFEGTSILLILA